MSNTVRGSGDKLRLWYCDREISLFTWLVFDKAGSITTDHTFLGTVQVGLVALHQNLASDWERTPAGDFMLLRCRLKGHHDAAYYGFGQYWKTEFRPIRTNSIWTDAASLEAVALDELRYL